MAVLIETCDLTHIYDKGTEDEFISLDKINVKIHEGEFVAIVGTNGSGKSTLAKHFNGLLLPTSGSCKIAGTVTSDEAELWSIRQQVGMVFQNPDNQLVATIVEEDVAFGPENLGVEPEEINKRVNDALQAVGMAEFRSRAPHQLSGGQKQRIAIAGALAMYTKCLVLDEPTAMLDPKGRLEVLKTVDRLHADNGLTIVYITHFMEEAAAADRIIVMQDGHVVADDKPAVIFSKVELMNELGLSVPVAAQTAHELRKAGLELPEGIVNDEELAVALCQFC